jgi:hypothetical protein
MNYQQTNKFLIDAANRHVAILTIYVLKIEPSTSVGEIVQGFINKKIIGFSNAHINHFAADKVSFQPKRSKE